MKISSKFIFGAAVAGSVIGGLAWGTPVVNLASPLLSTGTQSADIESSGDYESTGFKAFLKDRGPVDDSGAGSCFHFYRREWVAFAPWRCDRHTHSGFDPMV